MMAANAKRTKLARACVAMQAARLNWSAEMDADEVREVVGAIGRYNEFDPARVRALVDGIVGEMAAIPLDSVRYVFRLGREYSPCLYLVVGKKVIGEEIPFGALEVKLRSLGLAARADVSRLDRETRLRWEYRFFWD